MLHRDLLLSSCVTAPVPRRFCGAARAADDATAICKATISAYEAAAASGDPAKMGAVFAPDGEVVGPWETVAGHDALVTMYASFMKPGDKHVDAPTSARMIGDVVLCTGGFTATPASGASDMKASPQRPSAKWAASGRFSI